MENFVIYLAAVGLGALIGAVVGTIAAGLTNFFTR